MEVILTSMKYLYIAVYKTYLKEWNRNYAASLEWKTQDYKNGYSQINQ